LILGVRSGFSPVRSGPVRFRVELRMDIHLFIWPTSVQTRNFLLRANFISFLRQISKSITCTRIQTDDSITLVKSATHAFKQSEVRMCHYTVQLSAGNNYVSLIRQYFFSVNMSEQSSSIRHTLMSSLWVLLVPLPDLGVCTAIFFSTPCVLYIKIY
jgi:hypothetical protein